MKWQSTEKCKNFRTLIDIDVRLTKEKQYIEAMSDSLESGDFLTERES